MAARKKKAAPRKRRPRRRGLTLVLMSLLAAALIWGVVELAGRARPGIRPEARATPEITDQERQKLRDVIESLDRDKQR